MSLITEGMKMPEYRNVFGDERGCTYLLMLTVNKDGTASMQINVAGDDFHRVKEIPTPHGRLIDADYLIKVLQDTIDKYPDNCNDGKIVEKLVVDVCKQYIDHCPTIIEAEARE